MYHITLGAFEYILVSTAAALGDHAYGVAIREEIAVTTRRNCSIGALYTTIDRLEKKGLGQNMGGRIHAGTRGTRQTDGACDCRGQSGGQEILRNGNSRQPQRQLGRRQNWRGFVIIA
jgi:hypothetical protein